MVGVNKMKVTNKSLDLMKIKLTKVINYINIKIRHPFFWQIKWNYWNATHLKWIYSNDFEWTTALNTTTRRGK